MTDDAELLRQYAEHGAEDAFAELVRRHIDFVYAAALRQTRRHTGLAEDVTQMVFTDLARKATAVGRHGVVIGWLHTATRFAATATIRGEIRRQAREEVAHAVQEIDRDPVPGLDWARVQPMLDEVLGELKERERAALLLRYFEGKPLAEVGDKLGLSETAARSCVDRALDKLQNLLARRGVTSTTAAVGIALAGQGSVAAPAGFAAAVTSTALASVAAGGALAAGGAMFAFMSSTKLATTAGVVAALAIGTTVYQSNAVHQRDAQLTALAEQHRAMGARLTDLEAQLKIAHQRAAGAEEDNARLLTAIQNQSAAKTTAATTTPTASEPLTHDAVELRYRRGQELARTGDPAEALKDLLWCFDTGMPPITGYGGVRLSFLLGEIAKLGTRHPPALAALRERRDKAERRLLISATDNNATAEFSAINRTLNENARTLAVFDQLPADDRRRSRLAMAAFDDLVEVKRYHDAALGRTFAQMNQLFELNTAERPFPANLPNADRAQKALREHTINNNAKNVEVLAGSGNLAQARALAEKLLAYDGSPETRATLQKHLERAGQATLLSPR